MSLKLSVVKFKLSTPQLINSILVHQSPTNAAPHFFRNYFLSCIEEESLISSTVCIYYALSNRLRRSPK